MDSVTGAIGKDVHYVSAGSADGRYPSVCRAAKIVEIPLVEIDEWTSEDGDPTLFVMNPTGVHFVAAVPFDAGRKPQTWHWPH